MQASTINMAQALLDRGRELWEQDRYEEASEVLSRLLSLRTLSPEVAERAQFYLGDIQLAQGHYSRARRHLAAAIGSGIGIGETHFLMACALEWDDESDARAAYRHYRKAVELEPGQPLYSSAYALMRIRRRSNRRKCDREALARLRNSFAAAPDDPDIVYNYAYGLIEMERRGEAHMVLRRARNRWPDHPAFESLWLDFVADSNPTRANKSPMPDPNQLKGRSASDPVILQFPRPARAGKPDQILSPAARLATALRTLSASRLREISRNLAIEDGQAPADVQKTICRALRDGSRLRTILAQVSPGGRQMMSALIGAGGTMAHQELRVRVDPPARMQGPHWTKKHAPSPLDELRQFGLVYLAGPKDRNGSPDTVMVPYDLRAPVRRILASPQAN